MDKTGIHCGVCSKPSDLVEDTSTESSMGGRTIRLPKGWRFAEKVEMPDTIVCGDTCESMALAMHGDKVKSN